MPGVHKPPPSPLVRLDSVGSPIRSGAELADSGWAAGVGLGLGVSVGVDGGQHVRGPGRMLVTVSHATGRTAYEASAPSHTEPTAAVSAGHVHDVVVVGGGAAGLSAAVTLARSLRDVVVVDAGEPRNAASAGAHNLLGREGISPADLLTAGRAEAVRYGARLVDGRAVAAHRPGTDDAEDAAAHPHTAHIATGTLSGLASDPGVVAVDLEDGTTLRARRLVLATGLVDELPDVPGVPELWGGSVLHCPYCHGWEVRGQRIAVLGTGPGSVHQALLMRQLSPHVTLLRHIMPDPGDEAWEELAAIGVDVVAGRVTHLDTGPDPTAPALRAVVLEGGRELAVDAVAVAPRFVARAELYEQLGGTVEEHPLGGTRIPTGTMGATEVPGVWVAGNATDLAALVGAAAAAGVAAGAGVNADLAHEDAHRAVRAARVRTCDAGRTGPAGQPTTAAGEHPGPNR